jgi:hypothetical protein
VADNAASTEGEREQEPMMTHWGLPFDFGIRLFRACRGVSISVLVVRLDGLVVIRWPAEFRKAPVVLNPIRNIIDSIRSR